MTNIVDLISKLNYWLGHTVQSGPTWYEFVPDLQKAVTALGDLKAEKVWLAKRSDDLQTESNQWKRRAEMAEAELAKEKAAHGHLAKIVGFRRPDVVKAHEASVKAERAAIEAATIERCLSELERLKASTGSNNGRNSLDEGMDVIRALKAPGKEGE